MEMEVNEVVRCSVNIMDISSTAQDVEMRTLDPLGVAILAVLGWEHSTIWPVRDCMCSQVFVTT